MKFVDVEDNNIMRRFLEDEAEAEPIPTWEPVVTVVTVVLMFVILATDKVATESVMLTALCIFYLTGIIDIKEALTGFSSQGLLTVLILFVVAEGLNKTGALNWYIGKLFGRPKTLTGAQLRLTLPIAALSGFINDTPLVVVTLPIVVQWCRRVNLSPRFAMMPLSFAALLGGVITIIGTSTNLIIVGLLIEAYPDDPFFQSMPLFGLSIYGVPVALLGIAYMVLFTPLLLARNNPQHSTVVQDDNDASDPLLLRAKVTQFSPAADRTIRRSGLRDTGGIYLVRVMRYRTGNIHNAVGPDFVLQAGDVLYFTGLVETFPDFCQEHGLELVTNETMETNDMAMTTSQNQQEDDNALPSQFSDEMTAQSAPLVTSPKTKTLETVDDPLVGTSLEHHQRATNQERMRIIFHMEDVIHEVPTTKYSSPARDRVVIAQDDGLVVVGIDARDRSGLILDISKLLAKQDLELQHTEAAVRGHDRSLSIWRAKGSSELTEQDIAKIWSDMNMLLNKDPIASKIGGSRVVRAVVKAGSRLVGKTASEIDFAATYKAAIVAIQKVDGKIPLENLSSVVFQQGDTLFLQVSVDSALLTAPSTASTTTTSGGGGAPGRLNRLFRSSNNNDNTPTGLDSAENSSGSSEVDPETNSEFFTAIHNDLEVVFQKTEVQDREFMTAMRVSQRSALIGKTAAQSGIDKLPSLYLVSLERPTPTGTTNTTLEFAEALAEGDVLWFVGTARAIGDLRKIPGLNSYEADELNKMNERLQRRHMVEAVVARKGPLVGKTVRDVQFRTQYDAAVIAVHREGQRIHELISNIRLQAGDVLLMEVGDAFMSRKSKLDSTFVLMAQVKDSSPPRFRMLLPALFLTVAAYGCYVAKLSTLFGTALAAAILMVMVGVLTEAEAREAIRWEIFLTIAPAFGVGQALINSGVAAAVASFLVKIGTAVGIGDAGLLSAVYLSTVLISQLVANNAAAALIFPIAMGVAETEGIDLALMGYTIMLAASAAFMTPFGYQTNLMVMGPGGYSTTDFLIFGTPMQIVLWIGTTVYLIVEQWWWCWLGTLALLVAVVAFRLTQDIRTKKAKMD